MSLSETMTSLMDKFREKTGLTDKLTVARATNLMDHFDLHVNPNLLPQTEFTLNNGGYWENWNTFGKLKIKPNTDYTVSWRSKTSGKNTNVRIRIYDFKDGASNNFIVGPFAGYEFPLTSERQSLTFKVPADHPYDIFFYGNGSGKDSLDHTPVTFYDCKLEVGDLATPLNLFPNHEIRYLPKNNPDNNFDCYAIYTDMSIKMEYGKKYELIAETNGFFSNQHQPNVESNKCILWLTDFSGYTQMISDEHTAKGTVFTWGGQTGTYYLRVNAYHKSTTNTIYAYNIRIYEV